MNYYNKYLTQQEIRDTFNYNSKFGILEWKDLKNGRKLKVGYLNKKGYLVVGFHNKGNRFSCRIHSLIWIYHNGDIPDGYEIDHVNHIRDDNRIENLRLIPHAINCKNKSIKITNKSGINGVHWAKDRKKWVASIRVNTKLITLGTFTDKEDAIQAREQANITYGFHLNHGISV